MVMWGEARHAPLEGPVAHPDPDPTQDRVPGAVQAAHSDPLVAVRVHRELQGPVDREDHPVATDNPVQTDNPKIIL